VVGWEGVRLRTPFGVKIRDWSVVRGALPKGWSGKGVGRDAEILLNQTFFVFHLSKKPRFQRQKPGFVCHSNDSLIPSP
jgi:hypothetical protein